MTLRVRYLPEDDDVKSVADGVAESYVNDIVNRAANNSVCTILLTNQELVVNYVRLAIYKKLISSTEVEFLYKDLVMFSDKNGRLDWWPGGFCDYNDKILSRLLEGWISGE